MANMNNISLAEKELYAELEYLMVTHRHRCAPYESITTSNSVYLYRVKKALLKSVVEEKRIYVLKNLINTVKIKISNGRMFKEIFEPLPAIASDMLRAYRKVKVEEQTPVENDEYQDYIKRRVEYLDSMVNLICTRYEMLTRDELLNLEVRFNKEIANSTAFYGIDNATKEVFGSFYTGMIENTKKNFSKVLREKYGVVLKENEKLSDGMSNRLLLYKVAGLHYTNVMCDKRTDKIRPTIYDYPDKEAYSVLKNDVYLLGKVIRMKYLSENGMTPQEELIENFAGGQITFDDILKRK